MDSDLFKSINRFADRTHWPPRTESLKTTLFRIPSGTPTTSRRRSTPSSVRLQLAARRAAALFPLPHVGEAVEGDLGRYEPVEAASKRP